MKKIRDILLLLLYLLLLSSCFNDESEKLKHLGDTKEIMRLTLADASQPVFSLVYIAEFNGYFKELGLEINYLKFSTGRDALNSLLGGRSDIATVFETPVVIQAFARQPMSVLGTLHRSERNTGLVVRKDHGIGHINDLIGKKIAVPFNTNAQFFLNQYLSSHGLPLEDIKLVNIKPQEAVDVFFRGDVDAVAIWNPHLYKVQNILPSGQLTTYYSDLYSEMSMLVTLKEKVKTKRQAYLRLLQAVKKAETFFYQNPNKAKQIVIGRLKNNFDQKIIENIWPNILAEVVVSNSLFSLLEQEALWMKGVGIVANDLPDFSEYIDQSLLKEVDASAVTFSNN